MKTSAAPAEGLRDLVINALNDRKANQIKVIDVTTLTEITDYMAVSYTHLTLPTNREV